MSNLKKKIMKSLNIDFTKKNEENQKCKDDVIEGFAVGEFITLYSLKAILDDKPFYFSPFTAIDEKDIIRQSINCCDYRYVVCRLGYYSVNTGELYRDYKELDSVHTLLKKYSKNYDLVSSIFRDEFPCQFKNLYDYQTGLLDDKTRVDRKELYNKVREFMQDNRVFCPEFDEMTFDSMFENLDEEDLMNALNPCT